MSVTNQQRFYDCLLEMFDFLETVNKKHKIVDSNIFGIVPVFIRSWDPETVYQTVAPRLRKGMDYLRTRERSHFANQANVYFEELPGWSIELIKKVLLYDKYTAEEEETFWDKAGQVLDVV